MELNACKRELGPSIKKIGKTGLLGWQLEKKMLPTPLGAEHERLTKHISGYQGAEGDGVARSAFRALAIGKSHAVRYKTPDARVSLSRRRLHRPAFRGQSRRGVFAFTGPRGFLDAERRARDEPLGNRFSAAPRWILGSALVHSRRGSRSLRPCHSRIRARALGGGPGPARRDASVPDAQRTARRRKPGRSDRARLPLGASIRSDATNGAPLGAGSRFSSVRRTQSLRLPDRSRGRSVRAIPLARLSSACGRGRWSPRRDRDFPR